MRYANPMIESMEARRMMSVTLFGTVAVTVSETQPAVLLPAVQKVREAAGPSLGEIVVTKPTDVATSNLR